MRCYSGGGVIRVQNAGAESWFETAGGEIFVHQAGGPVHAVDSRRQHPRGACVRRGVRADRWRIDSGPAGRRRWLPRRVPAARFRSTPPTECGAIRPAAPSGCATWRGALRASTTAGSILAELAKGTRIEDSTLSTNAGDITVFIASNLPLTVAARNESGGATGRIISDFPEIRVRSARQPGASPVVAEGALNGGGPVLRINVNGGTIYLRRQK